MSDILKCVFADLAQGNYVAVVDTLDGSDSWQVVSTYNHV